MMTATEQLLVLVEVDEVDQQLLTHLAREAGRVPQLVGARPAGRHADVTAVHIFAALQKEKINFHFDTNSNSIINSLLSKIKS